MFFPFYAEAGLTARLRYFCTFICHFAFCTLIFDLLSYPLHATRYPLYVIRSAQYAPRTTNQSNTHPLFAKYGKKQNFLQLPLLFIP
jgi:hypothetical protein